MANVNAPFGLRPLRMRSGEPYVASTKECFATGATGAIYIGDPVVMAGSANSSAVQGRAPGTLPTVTIAADGDGDPIFGVCVGIVPLDRDTTTYRADSTDRIILVECNPDVVFVGQCDTAGTDWAVTDVGSYANLLVGSGNAYTGQSGWTLDTTDGPDAADSSNQLFILGLYAAPDNEVGEFARWEVLINNHQLANVGDGGRFTGV